MSDATYTLVFTGGIEAGCDVVAVKTAFGKLLALSEERVERIFDGSQVVLKRRLKYAEALRYSIRLHDIGMTVRIDTCPAAVTAPQGHSAVRVDASPPTREASLSSTPTASPAVLGLEFHGRGSEFFQIWIVNILLTIVTLGVYSAWAKVRSNRYFYANTSLHGARFEYLADPVQILKGRAVAFVFLLLYGFSDAFSPLAGLAMLVLLILVMPWALVRGLNFRNHNSAWRGVRFGFSGSTAGAYRVFLLWPVLGMLTFGLLLPYAIYRQCRFVVEGSHYGTTHFAFHAGPGPFYIAFLAAGGIVLASVALSMVLGLTHPLIGPVMVAGAYLAVFAMLQVRLHNLKFNHSTLAEHFLESDYRFSSYAVLMLTNTLATILTVGLFYPWARVRTARYSARHIRVLSNGDPDQFVAARRGNVSATGGEIGELFDFGLGV